MSLAKVGRVILAYAAASVVVLPLAAVGAWIADRWGVAITIWDVAAPVWLLAVGIPSVGWAAGSLSRILGVRPVPMLHVGSWRNIPIGGVIGDVARYVFSAPAGVTPASLPIAEQLTLVCGDHVFTEAEVSDFLRIVWRRQRAGKHGLARSYWVDALDWDRERYDALCLALEGCGIVTSRKPGAAGKLNVPPLTALHDLRHRVSI
jgi:hypothetical protein